MTSYIGPPDHWDKRYLDLCKHIAQWSKDPSTKVGACIVDPEFNNIVSLGFNGLPRGVEDTVERLSDRETKLKLIVHGERNAILFAGRSVRDYRLYTYPFMPCSICAGIVIQSGITEVIAPVTPAAIEERWGVDLKLVQEMFEEARVQLTLVDYK